MQIEDIDLYKMNLQETTKMLARICKICVNSGEILQVYTVRTCQNEIEFCEAISGIFNGKQLRFL